VVRCPTWRRGRVTGDEKKACAAAAMDMVARAGDGRGRGQGGGLWGFGRIEGGKPDTSRRGLVQVTWASQRGEVAWPRAETAEPSCCPTLSM
jgi:hypothetical protein